MEDVNLYKKIINNSPIDEIVIIWTNNPFKIEEIILSNPNKTAEKIANEKYPNARLKKAPKKLKKIIKELNKYFNEKDAHFSLDYLNLDKLTDFQRKVLIAEFNTEKGTVNSYKQLAKAVDNPKAYRAVGSALSKNPFPIIIPCHRTVKSDRTIGGFGGVKSGLESKKTLLELDGVMVEGRKVFSESPVVGLNKSKQRKITSYSNE
ncbi:MAG: methylated-DNA--[protein]-cysteine S-methyltransferase [Methanobacteriaceae archaeon]|nr:methylated-DNA--[protein]-cysteine S-methyltransferase [Methanobacteriaceae archaeon]